MAPSNRSIGVIIFILHHRIHSQSDRSLPSFIKIQKPVNRFCHQEEKKNKQNYCSDLF